MKTELIPAEQLFPVDDPRVGVEAVLEGLDVSEGTRADYKYRIGMFLDFVRDRGLTRNSYLDYKWTLASRPDYSVSTKNKYLATARVFLRELNRQGILPADITQNIKAFSQDKKHKRDGLNEAEVALLSEKARQLPQTPGNARLKAVLALLALQGLRQVEITRLDVRDVDLVRKTALVQGKGRDDKEPVDLHPETVKALRDYMMTNRVADGALFTSQSNGSKGHRLTTRGLREGVKQILTALGIHKGTHGFRHYFTTRLIKEYKGDLLEVARYTRHKTLEMLQVYNDNVKREADLPRYYKAFSGVEF